MGYTVCPRAAYPPAGIVFSWDVMSSGCRRPASTRACFVATERSSAVHKNDTTKANSQPSLSRLEASSLNGQHLACMPKKQRLMVDATMICTRLPGATTLTSPVKATFLHICGPDAQRAMQRTEFELSWWPVVRVTIAETQQSTAAQEESFTSLISQRKNSRLPICFAHAAVSVRGEPAHSRWSRKPGECLAQAGRTCSPSEGMRTAALSWTPDRRCRPTGSRPCCG